MYKTQAVVQIFFLFMLLAKYNADLEFPCLIRQVLNQQTFLLTLHYIIEHTILKVISGHA